MIIKKLAVPFINEKLLSQATHCYIASAALSTPGFEFVVNRLSLQCKVEIVTGLHLATEPKLLRRIVRHFPDRVQLHLYTKNVFHANMYIFDLPFRKAVAFVGSGNFTLGGIKDHEELFFKITDAKEIEGLKSWFTGYYEFAEPLTEAIVNEYEWVYPNIRKREIASRKETRDVLEVTTRGFQWDSIKFKNQFFKKEDYLAFAYDKASLNTPEIRDERLVVEKKLLDLHALVSDHLSTLKLYPHHDRQHIVSSLDPHDHPGDQTREMWIAYGRSDAALKVDFSNGRHVDCMRFMIIIRAMEVGIWLVPGKVGCGVGDRNYFKEKMNAPEYRKTFFRLLTALHPVTGNRLSQGSDYWIEIAGEKRSVNSFQNEDALWEFTKYDESEYSDFVMGKNFSPGHPEISNENLPITVQKELDKLIFVYRHMKYEADQQG